MSSAASPAASAPAFANWSLARKGCRLSAYSHFIVVDVWLRSAIAVEAYAVSDSSPALSALASGKVDRVVSRVRAITHEWVPDLVII